MRIMKRKIFDRVYINAFILKYNNPLIPMLPPSFFKIKWLLISYTFQTNINLRLESTRQVSYRYLTMVTWVKRANIISSYLRALDKKQRNGSMEEEKGTLMKEITSNMIKQPLPIFLKSPLTNMLIMTLPLHLTCPHLLP